MFVGDDCQMQQTQYGSNTAISETASHGTTDSQVAASDYPTPVESVTVSLTQLEQIDMWEPITQQPDDARTPHQLVIIIIVKCTVLLQWYRLYLQLLE